MGKQYSHKKLILSTSSLHLLDVWKAVLKLWIIWKSYMWTAEWRKKWRMIAVIYVTYAVAKRKPEKKCWLVQDPLSSAIPVQRPTNEANKPTGSRSLNWFVINPWKGDDEVSMNIWKSYMWTAEWRIKWRMIIAVIYETKKRNLCSCEKKAWKNFGLLTFPSYKPIACRQVNFA